jgi:hypothetical protein
MSRKVLSSCRWVVLVGMALVLLSVVGGEEVGVASQFRITVPGGVQTLSGLKLTGMAIRGMPTLDVTSNQSPIVSLTGPSRGEGTIGFYGGNEWKGQIGYGDVCGSGVSGLDDAIGICSYVGPTTLGTADQTTLFVTNTGKVGIGTPNPSAQLHVQGDALVQGDLFVTGTKQFVHQHPIDSSKEVVYVSLEGPEAGTYVRGTAELLDGRAEIALPEHFALVTSEEGCTVQLTPIGKWLQLYVVEKSVSRIVVQEATGRNGQFDYFVQGVRSGYEAHRVFRDREGSS